MLVLPIQGYTCVVSTVLTKLSGCAVPVSLQDAPYKKRGMIPYGVQRGSYGLTAEEKMRRRWREWSAAGSGANGSGAPALAAAAGEPSYQVGRVCWGMGWQGLGWQGLR
jgi:hypothetical protein